MSRRVSVLHLVLAASLAAIGCQDSILRAGATDGRGSTEGSSPTDGLGSTDAPGSEDGAARGDAARADRSASSKDAHAAKDKPVTTPDTRVADAAPAGPSWSTADPPTKDAAKAKTYCDKAIAQFAVSLPIYRDQFAPIGDLDTLYHMERMYNGMTAVYDVTGDVSIISGLLDIALKTIAAGKDLNSDGTLDYCFRDDKGNATPPAPGEPACDSDAKMMPTYPWRAMRGLARTFRRAKSSSLASSRAADVVKLQKFLRHDVIDKWLGLGGLPGQRGTDTAGIKARMASILLDYSYATADPETKKLAHDWMITISTIMKKSASHPDAYTFQNWTKPSTTEPVADTEHSNEIVASLIEAFQAGFLPYSFIEPLQQTLLKVLWNGDSTKPLFALNVDGTGGTDPDPGLSVGWAALGQFAGKTQTLMTHVSFSYSYDLEAMEAGGQLCRMFALALKSYPQPLP